MRFWALHHHLDRPSSAGLRAMLAMQHSYTGQGRMMALSLSPYIRMHIRHSADKHCHTGHLCNTLVIHSSMASVVVVAVVRLSAFRTMGATIHPWALAVCMRPRRRVHL